MSFLKHNFYGFRFSVPYLIILYAVSHGDGTALMVVVCVGALFGLPWVLMLLPTMPLTDVTRPVSHAFFQAISSSHGEWGAVVGWVIFVLGISVHLSGITLMRFKKNKSK